MSGSVSARSFGRDVTNKLTPRGVKWESPAAAGQDGNHVVDMPSFAAASINMADVKVAAFFTFVGSPFLDLVRLESYGARTWEGLGPPLDDFLRTRRDEAEAMALIEEGKGVGLFFTSSGTKFAHLLQVSAHESLREVNQAIINRLKLKRIAQVQASKRLKSLEKERTELARKLRESGIVPADTGSTSPGSVIRAIDEWRQNEVIKKGNEIHALKTDRERLEKALHRMEQDLEEANTAAAELSGSQKVADEARRKCEKLQEELAAARTQGTPRGEASKKVVELSFKRISELTSKLEAEQAKTAEAEARVRMLGETANRLHTAVMAQEKEATEQHEAAVRLIQELEEQSAMQSERLRALQMEKADTEEEAANLRREIRELEEASQSNDRSHKGMEARTAGLRAALEEANAKVLEYESKAGEMRQELQAMEDENLEFRRLLQESEDVCAKEAAEKDIYKVRVSELCWRLSEKEEEVMEAKAKGTPEGEGAKVVRDLAFRRIRLREEQLEKSEGCQARLAAQCEQLMLEGEELMRKLHESEAGRAKLEEEAVKLRGSLAAKESEVLEAWSHNETLQVELWDATAVLQAQEEESASRQAAAEVIAGVLRNRLAELEAEVEEKSAHNLALKAELAGSNAVALEGQEAVTEPDADVQRREVLIQDLEARLAEAERTLASLSEVRGAQGAKDVRRAKVQSLRDACEPLLSQLGDFSALSRLREMAAQTNVALAACRGEQHDALVSLRSSLGLMHLEREELQQDCKTLAILRAEQAAAMKICKQRLQNTVRCLNGVVRDINDSSDRRRPVPFSQPEGAKDTEEASGLKQRVKELELEIVLLNDQLKGVTNSLKVTQEAADANLKDVEDMRQQQLVSKEMEAEARRLVEDLEEKLKEESLRSDRARKEASRLVEELSAERALLDQVRQDAEVLAAELRQERKVADEACKEAQELREELRLERHATGLGIESLAGEQMEVDEARKEVLELKDRLAKEQLKADEERQEAAEVIEKLRMAEESEAQAASQLEAARQLMVELTMRVRQREADLKRATTQMEETVAARQELVEEARRQSAGAEMEMAQQRHLAETRARDLEGLLERVRLQADELQGQAEKQRGVAEGTHLADALRKKEEELSQKEEQHRAITAQLVKQARHQQRLVEATAEALAARDGVLALQLELDAELRNHAKEVFMKFVQSADEAERFRRMCGEQEEQLQRLAGSLREMLDASSDCEVAEKLRRKAGEGLVSIADELAETAAALTAAAARPALQANCQTSPIHSLEVTQPAPHSAAAGFANMPLVAGMALALVLGMRFTCEL